MSLDIPRDVIVENLQNLINDTSINFVWVYGPPGIGKTQIIKQAIEGSSPYLRHIYIDQVPQKIPGRPEDKSLYILDNLGHAGELIEGLKLISPWLSLATVETKLIVGAREVPDAGSPYSGYQGILDRYLAIPYLSRSDIYIWLQELFEEKKSFLKRTIRYLPIRGKFINKIMDRAGRHPAILICELDKYLNITISTHSTKLAKANYAKWLAQKLMNDLMLDPQSLAMILMMLNRSANYKEVKIDTIKKALSNEKSLYNIYCEKSDLDSADFDKSKLDDHLNVFEKEGLLIHEEDKILFSFPKAITNDIIAYLNTKQLSYTRVILSYINIILLFLFALSTPITVWYLSFRYFEESLQPVLLGLTLLSLPLIFMLFIVQIMRKPFK